MLTKAALANAVRAELRARRLRDELFGPDLSDTAWVMLLHLFAASLDRRRLCVMDLCTASRAPSTTALRALSRLVEAGRVERSPDGADKRRSRVTIAPEAAALVRRYCRSLEIDDHADARSGQSRIERSGSTPDAGLTGSQGA